MISGFFKKEKPYYSGELEPRELLGAKKKSFVLPFNGGEIWFEHLDGMYQFTELCREKLAGDIPVFRQTSKPSAIGFVLNETVVSEQLAEDIVRAVCDTKKVFRRVCFIGADKETQKLLTRLLKGRQKFAVRFAADFEKAKEWLVAEGE